MENWRKEFFSTGAGPKKARLKAILGKTETNCFSQFKFGEIELSDNRGDRRKGRAITPLRQNKQFVVKEFAQKPFFCIVKASNHTSWC